MNNKLGHVSELTMVGTRLFSYLNGVSLVLGRLSFYSFAVYRQV